MNAQPPLRFSLMSIPHAFFASHALRPSYHVKTLLASEENVHPELFHQLSKAMRPLMTKPVGSAAAAAVFGTTRAGRSAVDDGDDDDDDGTD